MLEKNMTNVPNPWTSNANLPCPNCGIMHDSIWRDAFIGRENEEALVATMAAEKKHSLNDIDGSICRLRNG
jgi:hypothetical protein